MFMHNKRLQYTVRVAEPNPALASLLLEQFGGPDGELAAAMRYFTQGIGEADAGRKDLLLDIATEELSHLEVIGSIVAMLNKGVKAQLSEAALEEAELYLAINSGGNSHTESILYGGGPALTNSSGVPWTAAYVDTKGDPAFAICGSNIAAEAGRKSYTNGLSTSQTIPGSRKPWAFVMTREIAHQKSFEKALYAIEDNFPSGKLPGIERYANVYVNASQGEGDMDGSWNSGEQWQRIDDLEDAMPMDEGDGRASVSLDKGSKAVADKLAMRTASDPAVDPATGADLGAGPGAGLITGDDKGGAKDIKDAAAMAEAI